LLDQCIFGAFLVFFIFQLIPFVARRVSIPKPFSSFQHSIFALLPSFSILQVISVTPISFIPLMLFVRPFSSLLLISINLTVF